MHSAGETKPPSLTTLFRENLSAGNTCVAYRLPQENTIQFCAGELMEIKENIPAGTAFLIAHFETQKHIYALSKKCFDLIDKPNEKDDKIEIPVFGRDLPDSKTQKHYTTIVKKAVDEIEAGKLEKVVLSRPFKKALPQDFSTINFFLKLTEKYPDAFVYLLLSNELGNWIGATPELLLKADDNEVKTVSLAGTRHISTGEKILNKGAFSQKEEHEQDVVSQYINQILTPFTNNIHITQPGLKKAGNLYHLQTIFSAELKDKNWLPLVKKLHPTPAVCGIPLQKAKSFIFENESYDRSLYSGFLGLVDKSGNTQLFVNLRCMQFVANECVLYVGAGIVKGSDPEKEWQETQHKMRTLLDVMDTL